MIRLKFDAQLIRAAMACQSDSKDLRYYLQGILLTTTGDIVGTNGNVLFHGKHNWTDCDTIPCDIILQIEGTIPASVNTVEIELPDFDSLLIAASGSADPITGTLKTDKCKLLVCTLLDGKYPDFNRVIPNRLAPSGDNYSNVIGLNISLLATLEKCYGKGALVNVYTRGLHNSIRVECPAVPDTLFVIMPVRTDPTDQLELKAA